MQPSGQPSQQPSSQPTASPTSPTGEPTTQPTVSPSYMPTERLKCPVMESLWSPFSSYGTIALYSVVEEFGFFNINFRLSSTGVLYCAAYEGGNVPRTTIGVMLNQFSTYAFTPDDTYSLILPSLKSDTPFAIYCTSRSLNSLLLSGYHDMIAASLEIHSQCCKYVSITLSSIVYQNGLTSRNAIQVSVNSAPSSYLHIEIVARRIVSTLAELNDTLIFPFFPSRLTIDRKTWTSVYFLSLLPLGEGNYSLMPVIQGKQSDTFAVSFPNGELFKVIDHAVPVQSPVLTKAVYDSSGLSVFVIFNRNTDMGLSHSSATHYDMILCSTLLDFPGAHDTLCYWKDAKTAVIALDGVDTAILNVGSNITLLPDVIRAECPLLPAECVAWNPLASATVALEVPVNPVVPVVVISGPTFVGVCSDVVLDLSLCSGSGGRRWADVRVKIVGVSFDGTNEESALNLGVDSFNSRLEVQLPQSILQSKRSCDIVVTLCNIFDKCGDGVHGLYIYSTEVPVVSIAGPRVIFHQTNFLLSLEAVVRMESCNNSSRRSQFVYSWCVNHASTKDASITSAASRASHFEVVPYTLQPNTYYEVTLTVEYTNYSSVSSDRVYVEVGDSDLIAVIDGPSKRAVVIGENLTLSAANSYGDQFHARTVSSKAIVPEFNFSWSCQALNLINITSTNSLCSIYLQERVDVLSDIIVIPIIKDFWDIVGNIVTFSVIVSDESTSRSALSHVEVTLLPDDTFVDITLSSSATMRLSGIETWVINPHDQIAIFGIVNNRHSTATKVKWQLENAGQLNLTAITQSDIEAYVFPGQHAINMVIPFQMLAYRPFPYVFTLMSDSGTFASISISINRPPSGGSFLVSPMSGYELHTTFEFFSSLWEDDDIPLSISFGYYTILQDGLTLINFLQHKRRFYHLLAFLPAGLTKSHALTTFVNAHDRFNAKATKSTSVTVFPNEKNLKFVIQSSVTSVLEMENANDIASLLSTISTTFNKVDCSNAPNCSALRRYECSNIAHTCGSCHATHQGLSVVGEAAEQNSPCLTADEYHNFSVAMRAAESDSCDTDVDCPYWHVCVQGSCHEKSKTCWNNCSGLGRCSFVNVNTGKPLDTCYVSDESCRAECNCVMDGYAGEYCQFEVEEMLEKQNITLVLLKCIDKIFLDDAFDIGIDELTYWSSSLKSIISQPCLLSANALSMSSKLMLSMFDMMNSNDLNMKTSTYQYVSQTLIVMLEAIIKRIEMEEQATCPHPLISEFVTLYDRFLKVLGDSLEAGQYSKKFISQVLRSSTSRFASTGISKYNHSIRMLELHTPLTSFEMLKRDSAAATMSRHINPLHVLSIASRLYGKCGEEFISNPFFATFDNVSNPDFEATFHLPNTVNVIYATPHSPRSWPLVCRTGDFMRYNFTCPIMLPSGENYSLSHTCTGVAERLTVQCPMVYETPDCLLLNDESNAFECFAVSYDLAGTDCACVRHSTLPASQVAGQSWNEIENERSYLTSTIRIVTTKQLLVDGSLVTHASIVYTPDSRYGLASISLMAVFFVCVVWCLIVQINHLDRFGKNVRSKVACDNLKCDIKESDAMSSKSLESLRSIQLLLLSYVRNLRPAIFRSFDIKSTLLPNESKFDWWCDAILKNHRYFMTFVNSSNNFLENFPSNGENAVAKENFPFIHILFCEMLIALVISVLHTIQVTFTMNDLHVVLTPKLHYVMI